jgi:hypothetical protein
MNSKSRPITKSVRLSSEESALLAEISSREHLAEGTLLRKWIVDALAQVRLEHAIADYRSGAMNLGELAAHTGMSMPRLLAELDARGVDTITPAHFRASLGNLAELFGTSDQLKALTAERPA